MNALKLGFACLTSLVLAAAGCSTDTGDEDDKIVTSQVSCQDFVYEFVIDASGSMNGPKWDATRDALIRLFGEFGAEGNPHIRVGMSLFGDPTFEGLAPLSMANTDAAVALAKLIDKDEPGGTVSDSREGWHNGLNKITRYQTSNRVVVLLTDGIPQHLTSDESLKQTPAELQDRMLFEVSDERAYGHVRTYVIGLGPLGPAAKDYSSTFMGQLAREGGMAPPGCDPASLNPSRICHANITPRESSAEMSDDLLQALHTMRARVESCH